MSPAPSLPRASGPAAITVSLPVRSLLVIVKLRIPPRRRPSHAKPMPRLLRVGRSAFRSRPAHAHAVTVRIVHSTRRLVAAKLFFERVRIRAFFQLPHDLLHLAI